jgi:hypothetical protein
MMRKRLEYRLYRHNQEDSFIFQIHGAMDGLFSGYMSFEEVVALRDFLNQKIRENPEWHRVYVNDTNTTNLPQV